MVTQYLNLDVVPGGVPVNVKVSQYDAGTRTLQIELYSSAGSFAASGNASIRGTKPDGNGFSYTAVLSGNIVTADVTKQMTAVAGKVVCEVVLTSGSKELATANFIIDVERAALDKDTLKSGSEIKELVDYIDRIDEILDAGRTVKNTGKEVAENAATVANLTANNKMLAEAVASNALSANNAAQTALDAKTETETVRDAAKADIETTKTAALAEMQTAAEQTSATADAAVTEVQTKAEQAKTEALNVINKKAADIAKLTTDADQVAKQALEKASNV